MSTGLQPHSLPRAKRPQESSLYFFPAEEARNRRDALMVGVTMSIIVHLLLVFGIPASFFEFDLGQTVEPEDEFEIQLMDPEPPVNPDFVETNQAAPENIPDNTQNFSGRDQQAANEELPEELSPDNTPAREGIDDPDAKVLAGELAPILDSEPVPEEEISGTTYQEQTVSNPQEQNPFMGAEEDEVLSEEGVGASLAEDLPNPTPVTEKIEGQDQPSDDRETVGYTSPSNPRHPTPSPRPRLPRALPGPVQKQTAGVSQTGYIGVDAKFSQFGQYMERMREAVQQRWDELCAGDISSQSGSHVVVEFRLTRDGRIEDLVVTDSTARGLGELRVRSAIEQCQPYGPWTEDMVQVFGDGEKLTFRFRYW